MFKINTAIVAKGTKKKRVNNTSPPRKKDTRYIITRELGVAGKIILKVYDKLERRPTFFIQGPLKKGHKYTLYVKRIYRNHEFVDKLENSDVLFEY